METRTFAYNDEAKMADDLHKRPSAGVFKSALHFDIENDKALADGPNWAVCYHFTVFIAWAKETNPGFVCLVQAEKMCHNRAIRKPHLRHKGTCARHHTQHRPNE
jgi:hypothetical protein